MIPVFSVRTPARVGLLGNPSDGYGGRVLAFALADFSALVFLEESARPEVVAGDGERFAASTWPGIFERLAAGRLGAGAELLAAAVKKLAEPMAGTDIDPVRGDPLWSFRLRFESDIPRQAGLAGSSAVVIGAMHAVMGRFDLAVSPSLLAGLALRAETEELGITAGPQDRVVQVNRGLLFMDFAEVPGRPGATNPPTRLDSRLLPPMYLAWNPAPGRSSGAVHDDVRARFDRGDPAVRRVMAELPRLADRGLGCLRSGDIRSFKGLVDENLALRAEIFTLDPGDLDMVRIGREHGAAVKLTGSGGAVIGVMDEESAFPAIEAAYEHAGYRALRPRVLESDDPGGAGS